MENENHQSDPIAPSRGFFLWLLISWLLFGLLVIWLLPADAQEPAAPQCPPQDSMVIFPDGPGMVRKGHFDNPDNYYTKKEWVALREQRLESNKLLEEKLKELEEALKAILEKEAEKIRI